MQPLLAASDLACRRGDRLLFKGLALEVAAGEALLVTGPNGSGKSSLIRLLAGLLRPYAGKVRRKGAVALLDERSALDINIPLGEALGFWARLDEGSGRDAAHRLGLGSLLDVPVRFLSTGQVKRAGLARMIAQGAPIWLLDEPLNGLDADGAELVGELIGAHCREGGIAVVASHQPVSLPGGFMQSMSLAA